MGIFRQRALAAIGLRVPNIKTILDGYRADLRRGDGYRSEERRLWENHDLSMKSGVADMPRSCSELTRDFRDRKNIRSR